jgi:hypothetical protein
MDHAVFRWFVPARNGFQQNFSENPPVSPENALFFIFSHIRFCFYRFFR